jgi:hypothetical protein
MHVLGAPSSKLRQHMSTVVALITGWLDRGFRNSKVW